MIQIPNSHWPPPPDPEFVPEGWLPIFEAYKLVGRDLFPDEWLDDQELAVPSDEEIAARKAAAAQKETRAAEKRQKVERAKRASVGVMSGSTLRRISAARPKQPAACRQGQSFPAELVQLINDETARKAARERGDKTWHRLRQWLFAGTVSAICIDDLGYLYEIKNSAWARPGATATLLTGQVKMNGRDSHVLVSQMDLEKVVNGEAEDVAVVADDDTTDSNVYTPPFLDFMIRATQELGLDAKTKVSKELIEEWLRNNWPANLGKKSTRKVETMATLLRQPEDQKGGYFKPHRDN